MMMIRDLEEGIMTMMIQDPGRVPMRPGPGKVSLNQNPLPAMLRTTTMMMIKQIGVPNQVIMTPEQVPEVRGHHFLQEVVDREVENRSIHLRGQEPVGVLVEVDLEVWKMLLPDQELVEVLVEVDPEVKKRLLLEPEQVEVRVGVDPEVKKRLLPEPEQVTLPIEVNPEVKRLLLQPEQVGVRIRVDQVTEHRTGMITVLIHHNNHNLSSQGKRNKVRKNLLLAVPTGLYLSISDRIYEDVTWMDRRRVILMGGLLEVPIVPYFIAMIKRIMKRHKNNSLLKNM